MAFTTLTAMHAAGHLGVHWSCPCPPPPCCNCRCNANTPACAHLQGWQRRLPLQRLLLQQLWLLQAWQSHHTSPCTHTFTLRSDVLHARKVTGTAGGPLRIVWQRVEEGQTLQQQQSRRHTLRQVHALCCFCPVSCGLASSRTPRCGLRHTATSNWNAQHTF